MNDDWMNEAAKEFLATENAALAPTTPEPAAADAWMDDAANEFVASENGRASNVIDFAVRKNPDQYASDLKKSKQFGLNVEDVEVNRAEVDAASRSIENMKAIQQSSAIKKAFENPDFAAIAHDDSEGLKKLDDTIKTVMGIMSGAVPEQKASKDDIRASFIGGISGPEPKGQQARQLAEQTKDFLPSIFEQIGTQFTLWDDTNAKAMAGFFLSENAQELERLRAVKALQSNPDTAKRYQEYLDSGGLFSSRDESLNPFARKIQPPTDVSRVSPNDFYKSPDFGQGVDSPPIELLAKMNPADLDKRLAELESRIAGDLGTGALISQNMADVNQKAGTGRAGYIAQSFFGMAGPMAASALPIPAGKGKAAQVIGKSLVGSGAYAPQIYGDSYGEMYQRILNENSARADLTDKQKQGLAHQAATESAIAHVITETGTEFLSLGFLKSNVGVLAKLFAEPGIEGTGEALGQAIQQLVDAKILDPAETFDSIMADPAKRELFWDGVNEAFIGGAVIGHGMGVAQVTGEAALKAAQDKALKRQEESIFRFKDVPAPDAANLFDPNRASPTTVDAAVQKQVDAEARTQQTKETIITLGEAVTETKLHTRSPEHMSEFVKNAVTEGENNVYIDVDEFVGYFQSSDDKTLEAVIDSIPGLNDQIETALIEGGDIVIPLTEFATKIAPTTHNAGFAEIARLRQEDLSPTQQKEFKAVEAQAPAEVENDVTFRESASQVHKDIRDALVATGKVTADVANKDAALHKAFASMAARELGILPHEAYQKYAVQVQAATTAQGLQQADKYSQAEKTIKGSDIKKGTAAQWQEVVGKDLKELNQWMKSQKGVISKQAVSDAVKENITRGQLLFQENEGKPRGSITFGQGIGKDKSLISLLENADLSTFLHESGHYFFEVLNDLAIRKDASPQLIADMEALVKFAGVESLQKWNSMTEAQRRPGHEKVADAFENYLMEGKSPSAELTKVFQRFRDWLMDVYKSIKRNVQLTDEVRSVFDRMLASQESIDSVKKSREYQALFDSAEEAGWTDASWAQYENAVNSSAAVAKDRLQTRLIKDMKWLQGAKNKFIKGLQADAAEKRQVIRDEVKAEVSQQQVYKAMRFFKTGELTTDGVTTAHPEHKLDIPSLELMYAPAPEGELRPGDPDWKKLGYGKTGMLAKDGLHPDFIAPVLGYQNGDAMINDMVSAHPLDEVVEQITDQRMLEKYGDITNAKALADAANEALHNSMRGHVLSAEFSVLAEATGAKRPNAKAAKAYAQAQVGKKKVRDIKPSHYLSAEAAASRKTEKALSESNLEAAAKSKLDQLLNHYLFSEANRAVKEIEAHRKYLGKFESDGIRKNLDIDYLDQIDEIRAQFDLRKSVSLREIDKRKSITEWIAEQEELGFQPAIDEDVVNTAKKTHYKDMTLDELRAVVDSVKQIEHFGRLKRELLTAKDNRSFNEHKDELVASLISNATKTLKLSPTPTHKLGKAKIFAGKISASGRTVASIVNQLDGNKDGGAAFENFFRGQIEAGAKEFSIVAESNKKILPLFNNLGPLQGVAVGNIYAASKTVPGTNLSMTHEQRIMLAAYWGDPQGRQRILDSGLDGTRGITEKEAAAVFDTLTEKDVTFIKGLWAHMESFRPAIAEQERRLTGIEPKWVKPEPFMTKFGLMEGGYVPLGYDIELSADSYKYEAMANQRLQMTGIFGSAATKHSYAKDRSKKVLGRPLMLSFDIIFKHVNEVAHRLAWQDYLTDASRMLKAVEPVIRQHYGANLANQISTQLTDIAKGTKANETAWSPAFARLRAGSVIAGIGYNVMTAAIQPTGYFLGAQRIGAGWMARGLKEVATGMTASYERAVALSEPLKQRWEGTMQREMNEIINTARKGDLGFIEKHAFMLVGKAQMAVDLPVFLGAFERYAFDLQLESAADETQRKAITEKASDMAYKAVLDSQSGGHLHEMSRMMRSEHLKLFTVFLNYMNMLYNRNVELYHKTKFKEISSYPTFVSDFLMVNIFPVIATVAIKELLKGDCDGDMECIVNQYEKEQLNTIVGQIFLLREASTFIEAVTLGKKNPFGYTGPAGLRFFAELAKLGNQIAQGDADLPMAKAGVGVAGTLLKLPAGQINKSMEGIIYVAEGNSESVLRSIGAILFGPPLKQKD